MSNRSLHRIYRSLLVLMVIATLLPQSGWANYQSAFSSRNAINNLQAQSQSNTLQTAKLQNTTDLPIATPRLSFLERMHDIITALAVPNAIETTQYQLGNRFYTVEAPQTSTKKERKLNGSSFLYLPLILITAQTPNMTAQGGQIRSSDGSIILTVPPGAVTEDVWISLVIDTAHPPVADSRSTGTFFRLTAFNRAGTAITQFAKPLTISIRYDAKDRNSQTRLDVFYFDVALGVWQLLPTTDDQAKTTLTATTTHFTDFAVLLSASAPIDCGIQPGQGASAGIAPKFIATFNALGGENGIGCPINEVYNWGGAPAQDFADGSTIVYNSMLGTAFYIGFDYWLGYENVGGPASFLGLPIQHSTAATMPPAYYQDSSSDFTSSPIQHYQYGFVGFNSYGGDWEGSRHFPLVCAVNVTTIQKFIDGTPTPEEPNPPPIEKKQVFLSASGIPDPSRIGSDSFRSMRYKIGLAGEAYYEEVANLQNQGSYYLGSVATQFEPSDQLVFTIAGTRSSDGHTGYTPQNWIINNYNEHSIPSGYGTSTLSTCAGVSLPPGSGGGGGVYVPPADTTPPTIEAPTLFQNGTGGVSIKAKVTDNVAVANVVVNIDGTDYPMAPRGGDIYEAVAYGLRVGKHQFFITATDTSGLTAHWPTTGTASFEIENSGYYGSIPWQGYSPDPVNTFLGNYIYQYTDLQLTSPGPDLVLERFYNAQSSFVGVFGSGWMSIFDMQVISVDNLLMSGAQVRYPDGRTVNFEADGDGFKHGQWIFDELARDGDGYLLTRTDNTYYHFNADGKLTKISDQSDNTLSITWEGDQLSQVTLANGKVLTFVSNAGRISQINAPDAVTLTYNYTDDQLVKVQDGTGAVVQYQYDASHGMTVLQTPQGHTFLTEQTFDDQGRVIHQKVGDNFINDFTYDDVNRVTIMTDTYGNTITYKYDEKARLIEQIDALGHSEKFEYNDDNQRTKYTDRNGNVTQYEYNANGDLVKTIDPLGHVTTTTYDDQHHVLSRTDPLGRVTSYEYDVLGRQTAMIDALGQRSETRYNDQGQVIEQINTRGFSTFYTYNADGNLETMRDALGHITRYEYDSFGRKVKTIDALGRVSTITYDKNGNIITQTDALGYSTTYIYDDNNNRTSETDGLGHTTTYTYSQLDNLLTTTSADGGVTSITYDDMNHRIAETDQLGNTTRWTLDKVYRVISETNALGAVTGYQYDPQGNRTAVIDARGFVTRYEFDALNRVTKLIDPLGGETRYLYDAVGNRIAEINPRGAITNYVYDALNRVIKQTDAEGYVTTYEYDTEGNRIKQTDALSNTATTSYDALNRPDTVTDALGNTTRTTYDAVGNITAVTDALGFITQSEYDALNRPVVVTDALGNSTRTTYDAVGNIIAVTDALGFVTRTEYDVMNHPIVVIDALGGRSLTAYDLAGRRTQSTDANGHTTSYGYDVLGRTIVVTDALGFTTKTRYDLVGNPVETINQNGVSSLTEYDALNRITVQTNGLGFKTRFTYDGVGNILTTTNALGFVTSYTYDLLNHKLSETNALGHTTTYEYDALGRVISTTYADGSVLRKEYDALGHVISMTDAEGFIVRSEYDAVGNQIKVTDANGFTTITKYDGLRRPVEATDSIGLIQKTVYDAVGNVVATTDGNGHATIITYDGLRRRTAITDPRGNRTQFSYDAVGNMVSVTDGNNHTTTISYDARNQRISETDPLGSRTTYDYDGVGNKISSTDALGIKTVNRYDAVGQLIAVTLNQRIPALANADTNVTTQYIYDAVGNRVEVTDPNGHRVKFTPDALGQLVAETDPLGNITRYTFNEVGRQIQRDNPNGTVIKSFYDRNGSLIRTMYPRGDKVLRSYDGNRNMLTVDDRSGLTTRIYDARNRLVSETTSRGTVKYSYDLANNRLSLQNADGTLVRYGYFPDNQLQTVTNPDGAVTTYERDGVDQVTRQNNGNNTISVNVYDAANHLLTTATNQTGGKLIASVRYRYNVVGQRTDATFEYRTGQPKTVIEGYTYDALRRLIKQTDNQGVQTNYTYDPTGNRLVWQTTDDPRTPKPNDALTMNYSYSAADELLRTNDTQNKVVTEYLYDANGNRLEQQTNKAGTAYQYDAENRLVTVQAFAINGKGKRIDHEIATMLYDGDGRRVAKSEDHQVGGGGIQTTTYVHDGLDVIASNETWHPQHSNLYRADAGRILTMDSFAGGNTGQTHWFSQDGLGSTLALAKSDGQAEHHYQYDAFGGIKPDNSGNFGPHNEFTFTGQQYDEFIGLYHYHARTYDQTTGTWLTRDPYSGTDNDPQSLHRYGYVKGDPINLVDVYGYAAQGGTYGKGNKSSPIFNLLNLIVNFTKGRGPSGILLDWKLPELEIPKSWPLPSFLTDPINKFLPHVSGGIEIGYSTEQSSEFKAIAKSDGTIEEGLEKCISTSIYTKGHIEADLLSGKLWIINASAGLGVELGVKGEVKGCFGIKVGANNDQLLPDISFGLSLEGNITLTGQIKGYVQANVDVWLAFAKAEAGVKLDIEYPLISCKGGIGDIERSCLSDKSTLSFSPGVYAQASWGGTLLGKGGDKDYSLTVGKFEHEFPSLIGLFRKIF